MSENMTTLHRQLDQLRTDAQRFHDECPAEADFIPAFACEADGVVETAERLGRDAIGLVHERIDEILSELGYRDAPTA